MSIRKRFFRAMRREDDSFVPFEFSLCPSLQEVFQQLYNTEDYAEHYDFPTRSLKLEYLGDREKYRAFHDDEAITLDDWGVGHKKGSTAHFTKMQPPMKDFNSIADFEAFPYPDPDKDYNWESIPEQVQSLQARDLIAVAPMETTIFERAWYMRGMDQFLMDMTLNPDLAAYHLERICAIKCRLATNYAQAGADVIRLGDDVSTQLDMMMSPDMWREFIKPRLARVIEAAKAAKPDILVFYHGDGNLQRIIPDLIEVGVEILNPIQPECMDPVAIKAQYGDQLSLWGAIGTQTTMPFGTPAEVVETCKMIIESVGKGGGLFLAPTHVLEPEVPWENIEAFVKTVREYNNQG